jgi:hypothetical protein
MYFAGEKLNDGDRFLATAGKNRERLIVALSAWPDEKEKASVVAWDIVLHEG